MPYNAETDGPLRSGASNPHDEYAEGISPAYSARLAEEILTEPWTSLPGTFPGRSGVPQGYGKWGDLA